MVNTVTYFCGYLYPSNLDNFLGIKFTISIRLIGLVCFTCPSSLQVYSVHFKENMKQAK